MKNWIKKIITAAATILLTVSAAHSADWSAFVIRNGSTTGAVPGIFGTPDGQIEVATVEGGQKVGLGTDLINGAKISQIATLHIGRLDDVASSGSLYGPYFNIWVTDGAGHYAVIANEPSNAEWADSRWDVANWDFLKTKTCKVYETPGWNTGTSWLHTLVGKTSGLTFEDVADLIISPPPVAYINDPANAVGSGAPDEIGTSIARGFNWIFGDTAANYISGGDGFIVNNYSATANTVVNTTQGTAFTTIQAAVAAAAAGDTINVGSGSYSGNLTIDKALSLVGPNAGISAVTGTRLAEAEIAGQITVTADDVTIEGLSLTNPTGTVGIYAKRCSGLTVNNNIIHDINSSGTGSASGIYVLGDNASTGTIPVSDITITGNHIYAIGGPATTVSVKGIYFGDSNGISLLSNVLVQGNRVENVITTKGAYGIMLNYGVYAAGTAANIEILDNIVTDLEGLWVHGIGLETDTAGTVVQGNDISDLRDNKTPSDAVGIFFEGNPSGAFVVVSENILRSSMGWGVAVHPNDITAYGYTVDASANYWDSAAGPGAEVASGMNVSYDTYYADEAMTQLLFGEVFVDDDFDVATPGWGEDHFAAIQDGIDATMSAGTLNVAAGTYAENLVVSRAISMLGPNAGISPNSGTRTDEAIIMSASSGIDSLELVHVAASDVTIRGFTFDGDNPALTSGFLGVNGADIDAAEAITVYENNVSNLVVSENIIQNLSYFGVSIFGGEPWYSPPATAGHVIEDNLIRNLGTYDTGSGIAKWGGGVLLYNDQYARITDNVMTNVRLGVQTGNFHDPNPGSTDYQMISGNVIMCRRLGIFHNLQTVNASPYTLADNVITGLADANESSVKGILLASLSTPAVAQDNVIDLSGITSNSIGYEVWNVDSTTPAAITGGSVLGAQTGVFVNNWEGYSSDAGDGGHAVVSGLAIEPRADGTGILVRDSANSTAHQPVSVVLTSDTTVNGGANGLLVEGANASAAFQGTAPAAFSATAQYIALADNAVDIDATMVAFDGKTAGEMSEAEQSAVEAKVFHQQDDLALGRVTWLEGAYFGDTPFLSDMTIGPGETVIVGGTMSISNGASVTVNNGTLKADSLDLGAGSSLVVINGELELTGQNGEPTVMAGTFTIFDSWGSVYFDADTELSGDTIALVSHLVFADGVELAVSGGLTLDGCVLEAEDGGSYSVVVSNSASLTMVRNEMSGCDSLTVATGDALIKDNVFAEGLTITAEADGAEVFHNIFTDVADLTDNGLNTVLAADGWGNIAAGDATENNLGLTLAGADAEGNLYIQPGDAVSVSLDLSDLSAPVSGLDALMGFDSLFLGDTSTVSVAGGAAPWTFDIYESLGMGDATYGQIDKSIGVDMTAPLEGTTDDAAVLSLDFTTTDEEGVTKVFFRVGADGDIPADTRLVSAPAGLPEYLSPFTVNSGYITIDGTDPVSDIFLGVEDQSGTIMDVFDPAVLTEQGTVYISMSATDELSGLNAENAVLTLTHQVSGATLASSMISTHTAGEMAATCNWAVVIGPAVENGIYDVEAVVADRSGNTVTNTATIEVNKTTLEITVELIDAVAVPFDRDVTFVMTDAGNAVIDTWTETVSFVNTTGTVSLTQLPDGVAAVSADTDWTLRTKMDVTYDANDQGTVELPLLGGDLNNDNLVDMLDFARLRYFWMQMAPQADVNGDGAVNAADYGILRANWYVAGDAQ